MAAAEAFAFATANAATFQTGELRPIVLNGSRRLADQLRDRNQRLARDDEELLLLWSP